MGVRWFSQTKPMTFIKMTNIAKRISLTASLINRPEHIKVHLDAVINAFGIFLGVHLTTALTLYA